MGGWRPNGQPQHRTMTEHAGPIHSFLRGPRQVRHSTPFVQFTSPWKIAGELQRAAQLRRVCEDRKRCSDGTVRARDLPYVQDRHGHLPGRDRGAPGSALHV